MVHHFKHWLHLELVTKPGRPHLDNMDRTDLDRRDIEIINRNSVRLNREARDVLDYQDSRWDPPGTPPSRGN